MRTLELRLENLRHGWGTGKAEGYFASGTYEGPEDNARAIAGGGRTVTRAQQDQLDAVVGQRDKDAWKRATDGLDVNELLEYWQRRGYYLSKGFPAMAEDVVAEEIAHA